MNIAHNLRSHGCFDWTKELEHNIYIYGHFPTWLPYSSLTSHNISWVCMHIRIWRCKKGFVGLGQQNRGIATTVLWNSSAKQYIESSKCVPIRMNKSYAHWKHTCTLYNANIHEANTNHSLQHKLWINMAVVYECVNNKYHLSCFTAHVPSPSLNPWKFTLSYRSPK